ncbi:MAG: transglutaminase-like domain-containing protein, partial [Candidatus Woesearchaeota archaeon]
VIMTKQGVCDEITNLFISMNRALGIPAKFVSGIAYTNLENVDPWGPHGWAEVYFPDYGWIPFDVTYGEFGYIDSAHIKFRSTIDSNKSSINYEYRARNAKLVIGKLLFNTEVVSLGRKIQKQISISVEPWKSRVAIGSYNVIIAEISNNNPYYVADEIYLAHTQNVEYLDKNKQNIILKPFEKKTLAWIVKINEDLDTGYIYTFPIKVIGSRDETAEAEFSSSSASSFYSYDEAKRMADSVRTQEITLPYSEKILLSCSAINDYIYVGQEYNFYCTINNTGNKNQRLTFCVDEVCEQIEITAKKTENFEKKIVFRIPGVRTLIFTLQNDEVLKNNYLTINIYDVPSLKIIDLAHPDTVNYKDEFTIDFNITKKSSSTPKNIRISLTNNVFSQSWNFENFISDQNFRIKLSGSDLSAGKNNFMINMTYYDERYRLYSEEKNFVINLENLDLAERIMIFIKKISYKIEKILTDQDERTKFFKNPNTWINIGVVFVIIVLIKIGFYFLNKKREKEIDNEDFTNPKTKIKSE